LADDVYLLLEGHWLISTSYRMCCSSHIQHFLLLLAHVGFTSTGPLLHIIQTPADLTSL